MAKSHVPSIQPLGSPLFEIVLHLRSILSQIDPLTDDPIIVEHVRTAHEIALGLHREAQQGHAHA